MTGLEQTGDARNHVPGAERPPVASALRGGLVLGTALEATAIALVAGLVATGHGTARPVELLVLVAVVALATNRDTLFTSELAATTEVSAFLCAVVVFRDDGAVLAPMLLGLVSGWLDVHHLRSRAFARMAFNSGKHAWAAAAAAATFATMSAALGPGPLAQTIASAAACAAFVAVDSGLLVTLLVVGRRDPLRRAVADVARVDRWSPLFAVAGAAVGAAATVVPWWVALLALIPLALIPLAPVSPRVERRSRPRWRTPVVVGVGAAGAAVTSVLGTALGAPTAASAAVAVLAVGVGLECAPDADGGVVPLAWAVALVALVALPGATGVPVAIVAGLVVLATTTVRARRTDVGRSLLASVAAVALTAVTFAAADATRLTGPGRVAATLAAGIAFWCVVVAAGPRRRARAATGIWMLPMIAGVAAIGVATPYGRPAALASVAAFGAIAAAAGSARWGILPWRSRYLAGSIRARARRPQRFVVGLLVGALSASVLAAAVGLALDGAGRAWAVAVAAVTGDGAVAMVAVGARQWRLAPRARVGNAALLGTAAGVITLVMPAAAEAGADGWSLAALVVPLAATTVVARRIVPLAAAAPPGPERPARSSTRADRPEVGHRS